MPVLHLVDGESIEAAQFRIKENGWVAVLQDDEDLPDEIPGQALTGKPTEMYPPERVKKVEVDDDIYTESYLVEEEYSEHRKAKADEPGESVTEFKPVHRIELEYHIE